MSEEASIFEVVESGFDCYVIENSCKVPVLVEFMGVWSEPCALMADILSDLANGRTGRHRDAAGIYCKGIVVFDLRPYHASISSLLGGDQYPPLPRPLTRDEYRQAL